MVVKLPIELELQRMLTAESLAKYSRGESVPSAVPMSSLLQRLTTGVQIPCEISGFSALASGRR